MFGNLVLRNEFGRDHPEIAAKILAVYLRGVSAMQNMDLRDEAMEIAAEFFESIGVSLSMADIERDFLTRPVFDLDGQLQLMSRNQYNGGLSTFDGFMMALSSFLSDQGVVDETFPASGYTTSKYAEMISEDKELRAFAFAGSTATSLTRSMTPASSFT